MVFMLIKVGTYALHIVTSLRKCFFEFVIHVVDLVALIRCIWS